MKPGGKGGGRRYDLESLQQGWNEVVGGGEFTLSVSHCTSSLSLTLLHPKDQQELLQAWTSTSVWDNVGGLRCHWLLPYLLCPTSHLRPLDSLWCGCQRQPLVARVSHDWYPMQEPPEKSTVKIWKRKLLTKSEQRPDKWIPAYEAASQNESFNQISTLQIERIRTDRHVKNLKISEHMSS